MKRVIALLLGIMILLSGVNLSAATETLEQKANRLNTLSILKGDGKSYNLAGTLTRQEAATFIVRLLGAEKEVLANKGRYSKVSFTDMKSTDWSAPYVGYCVDKGIINGYTDNTFRPTAKLELQAFSKLLLVSLGYINNKDFTWDTTLRKAQDIKLVTAEEVNLAKGNPFTRGDVVNLLNRVLTMKNVQSEKEMFYNLLKTDGITEQTLVNAGLIVVRQVGNNVVEKVRELAAGEFSITFSTPPKKFSADNVVIVEESGRNLKVKSIKATDLLHIYNIVTDKPSDNAKYQLLIKGVEDREGKLFKEYKKEMIAFMNGPLESDYFHISQINGIDKKNIEVSFTHPVAAQDLNERYFTIWKDGSVFASAKDIKLLPIDERKVKLSLTNLSFEEDKIYDLRISGEMKSKLGVRINNGKEENRAFRGKAKEEEKLSVLEVQLTNRNAVRLVLNKKVDKTFAETPFNYTLKDSSNREIRINKASLLNNEEETTQSILLETDSTLLENRSYVLIINLLYNVADVEDKISKKEFSFNAGYNQSATFDLSYASQVDPYTIEFGFDTTMDMKTATNPNNYYIRKDFGGKTIVPVAVYHDYEHNRLYLYLAEPLTEKSISNYNLYAKTEVRGANGEQRRDHAKVSFSVSEQEMKKVGFEKVNYIGDNVIQVLFDEPIVKQVPNMDPDNFAIFEKDTQRPLTIDGVRYIDGRRLSLKVSGFDRTKSYVLKVKEILEYNGKTRVTDLPLVEIEGGNLVQ